MVNEDDPVLLYAVFIEKQILIQNTQITLKCVEDDHACLAATDHVSMEEIAHRESKDRDR